MRLNYHFRHFDFAKEIHMHRHTTHISVVLESAYHCSGSGRNATDWKVVLVSVLTWSDGRCRTPESQQCLIAQLA